MHNVKLAELVQEEIKRNFKYLCKLGRSTPGQEQGYFI